MFTTELTDVVLVGIAKYENDYIEEWISYHLNLGFDKIFVYDDGDGDVPYLDEMPELQKYIKEGRLGIERCAGIEKPQCKVYEKFYKEHSAAWIMYLDIDEFLWLRDYDDIHCFLKQEIYDSADVINFSWVMIGSNGQYFYNKDIPVNKRFKLNINDLKNTSKGLVKSIVRGCLGGVCFGDPHIPWREKGFPRLVMMLPNGTINEKNCSVIEKDYSVAYVKHFFTKSMEEFLTKKVIRGSAFRKDGTLRNVNHYWQANEKTEDAEIQFKKFIDILKEKRISINDGSTDFVVKENEK